MPAFKELQATAALAQPMPRVALVGGMNMDITAQAATALTAGDSTPGHIQRAPGGVARNVAENLARLGLLPCLVSVVGDDHFGDVLIAATGEAGVDVSGVARLHGQRTATYVSMHGPDGEVAMAVNDMAILDSFGPAMLASHRHELQRAPCVVVDCNLSQVAIDWIMADAGTGLIFVDAVSATKCLRIRTWLDRVHTLKVNALEAQTLTGIAVRSADDACHAAVHLHQLGVRHVVVSLGAQGLCWCDEKGMTGHLGSNQLHLVNTSGAGDALLAGLVHAHLRGLTLPEAIRIAMACAAVTLQSPYANAPNLSLATVQSALSF